MPEQDKERQLEGGVTYPSSSDEAVTKKFEDAVRLLKLGTNTPLRDAELVNESSGIITDPNLDAGLAQPSHDGYDLPSIVVNPGGLPLSEFARYLSTKRRVQKSQIAGKKAA